MPERFNFDQFVADGQLFARLIPADELFGFFTRETRVPPSCVVLAYDGARQTVVGPGGQIEAGGTRELLVVRNAPFHLNFAFAALPSRDGFAFAAEVTMAVAVVPERIELDAFRQGVLGARREVRADRLRQHCEDAVRAAAAAFIASRDAADLVVPATWDAFDAALMEAFAPLGFQSGLTLDRDPRITLRSPAFAEAQGEARAAMLRTERDKEDAARRADALKAREGHLAELAGMVERVKSLAGGSGLNVADIIRTFDVTQRGQLYQGLIGTAAPARMTRFILAIAGGDLLWIDPADLRVPARRQSLPVEAGALRSVRVVDHPRGRRILVGAKHGVHSLDDGGEDLRTYTFTPPAEIRGGVNAASIGGAFLFATHSEVGLLRWKLDDPKTMRLFLGDLTEGSKAVRDVQIDDAGRVWLAVDNIAVGFRPDSESAQFAFPAPSEITTLTIADGHAVAGLRDGSIARWLIGESKPAMEVIRPALGKAVLSIDWIAGGGIPRVLIGDGRPHLDLQVLGDSYSGQYRCLHTLKWGFGADDVIVGVNDRRDHLFAWDPAEPETPRGAMAIGRLTGRSIQDVAILSA